MKLKIIGLIIGIGVFGGLIITSFLNSRSQPEQPLHSDAKIDATSTIAVATTSTNQTTQHTTVTTSPTPAPVVTTDPIPAPPAINTYTSAQVAVHADRTSCWSIVNDNVYDLTSWIDKHPGGEKEILSICGKDGSRAFEGQHGGDSKPEKILASYFIGTLIK